MIVVTLISVAIESSHIAQPSFATTNGGSITALGVPLTENFDTLASAGTNITWTDNSTIPGWYSTRATYNSGTGSSNTGALYSFGVAGTNPVTDRALGSVASGGTGTVFQAARLTNNTGATIASLDISYVGEQWRNGGNTAAHTLTFQYQVANAGVITGANAPATGWTTFARVELYGPGDRRDGRRRLTATRRPTASPNPRRSRLRSQPDRRSGCAGRILMTSEAIMDWRSTIFR